MKEIQHTSAWKEYMCKQTKSQEEQIRKQWEFI